MSIWGVLRSRDWESGNQKPGEHGHFSSFHLQARNLDVAKREEERLGSKVKDFFVQNMT